MEYTTQQPHYQLLAIAANPTLFSSSFLSIELSSLSFPNHLIAMISESLYIPFLYLLKTLTLLYFLAR